MQTEEIREMTDMFEAHAQVTDGGVEFWLARDLQFTKHFQQGVLQLLTDFGLSSCGHRHSWFVLWVWSNMYVFQF